MLQETRLTMPVMTPDSALLFIFRLPLLNFGGRYQNGSRYPPFESRDKRFVRGGFDFSTSGVYQTRAQNPTLWQS
jgi:hypothetical protein